MSGPKESQTPQTAEDGHSRISRRRFLGGLLGVAGAVLGGLGSPGSAKAGPDAAAAGVVGHPPSDQEPRIAAQEYVQSKWGVELVTFAQAEPALAAHHPEVPAVWDEPSIITLDESLSRLKGGYAPRPTAGVEPIKVVLGNEARISPLLGSSSPVEVDFRVMTDPAGRKVAFVDLTVLLVTRAMSPIQPGAESFHKTAIPMEAEWVNKINGILGGEAHSAPVWLRNVANDRGDPDTRFYPGDPDFATGHRGSLSLRLDSAVNTGMYPLGLLRLLVEESLYGQDSFMKGLSKYIPEDKVAELYDFVRDDVWQGKPFEAFPMK
ncbi:twin-arginine translocation signal domain-containing protein [Candidatus Daviesbacteria bacterium]|nr:twin-arginine translocation signal domain-containing protein [Candidatus Daviesbacteria bacterium]